MRRRLILCGPVGCGKSTLIRGALGAESARAGGFVTLRRQEGGRLLGFDLAPARVLACPEGERAGRRFLELSDGVTRHDWVFEDYGTALLQDGASSPFAVADEFGGLELLLPRFGRALTALLEGDIPCVGVLKAPEGARALAEKAGLGEEYLKRAAALKDRLERDPDTLLLPTAGRGDRKAEELLRRWADRYVRGEGP